jgi:tetratricopeptide (TPR) repeat protein
MERPNRRVDKDGFPIPATFEDNPKGTGTPDKPATLAKGWVLVLILAPVLVALVLGGLFGGGAWTQMLMQNAATKYQEGDLPGALAELDKAASWSKDLPAEFYQLRGIIRSESGDLEGAEADLDQMVKLSPDEASGYTLRSQVYQRQSFRESGRNRHAAAIADLGQAIRLSSNSDPMPRNNRAYARALAGAELKEGLADAEQSVKLLDKMAADPLIPGSADRNIELAMNRAAILDTRGYLHHLLGNQEQALKDLNESLKLSAEAESNLFELQKVKDLPAVRQERLRKQFRDTQAVLRHHRSLIHDKLGNAEDAATDREQAKKMGYDPQKGVF